VTYSEITTIVCLDHRLVKRAVAQWEKRTDKKLVKKDAWKTISLDELIATLMDLGSSYNTVATFRGFACKTGNQ
jgi:3-dehydroquinate synthase class II